jgi:hypothetical protein
VPASADNAVVSGARSDPEAVGDTGEEPTQGAQSGSATARASSSLVIDERPSTPDSFAFW